MSTPPSLASETLQHYLSGIDSIAILEIINRCITSSHLADLGTVIYPALLKLFHFDFSCALICRPDRNNDLIIRDAINFSYPIEFIDEFVGKKYFSKDMIAQEYISSHRLQHWTEYKSNCEMDADIPSLCHDFNMKYGYVHGAKPATIKDCEGLFIFSGPNLKYEPRTHAILGCLIPHMQQFFLANAHPAPRRPPPGAALSHREIEVLQWLQEGKCSWDIALILCISERTVNFHVYNIMKKLDAMNRTQAVATALRQGFISL